MSNIRDSEFEHRREQARSRINQLDRDVVHDEPERENFFNTVYDRANEDAAQIPWADLEAKSQIKAWLAAHHGEGSAAIDVACGLGDHAEELADVGYETTAFDISDTAIKWARQRFPESKVNYLTANLFDLPSDWPGSFDLVNECYTLQALPPQMLEKTMAAIVSLVKPGGILLVYTRIQADPAIRAAVSDGPPWPLAHDDIMQFQKLGFSLQDEERFAINRGDRVIPHQFAVWRKTN